ncbi:MAG TPA: hypothetical protein PK358_01580 [Spirochaetota bacterium]|nr:hypothetical protein [Spirochaetota bacterium]HPJ33493.1 hypothetical protein [Spirochaetota bacterium]
MKYIKLIILAAIINFSATGCSYVSDMIEGAITERASFSIEARQVGDDVVITWNETDHSSNFAGIEIYRTREANDEYSGYVIVADYLTGAVSGDLSSGTTTTCTVNKPADDSATVPAGTSGIYFYRVGLIHWDEDEDDRTAENGYLVPWDGLNFDTNYNNNTDINEVSGSAMVEIN